jgi:hypothetical protein
LQNYPDVVSAQISANQLVVNYRVDTNPAFANYGPEGLYVEFFISTPRNEGWRFLGFDFYTVANFGATKTIALGDPATFGFGPADRVTATATDASGNTSEFYPAFLGPTAAEATLSGRLATASGQPLANAQLTLRNLLTGATLTATTAADGTYRLTDVPVGGTYLLTPAATGYNFAPPNRLLNVLGDLSGVDFVATGAHASRVPDAP